MHNFDFGQTVVTGGAGLIGSAAIWGLNNLNHKDIWLVDWINSLGKKQRNLENLLFERSSEPDHFRNLIKQNSIELKKVKTVIHLGACSSTTETNQKYLDDNNFLYTKEICEWLYTRFSLLRKAIYISLFLAYTEGIFCFQWSTLFFYLNKDIFSQLYS